MVTLLEQEMYTEAGAASLLGVPQPTLHYWLEGKASGTKTYRPVIREHSTGNKNVTWAEFIEAGLLRQYRRVHNVPMAELRALITHLQDSYGIPYPLAHAKPFISGRELLLNAQDDADLHPDFALVATVNGQLVLTPSAEQFYQRVTWINDVAAKWRPASADRSTVVIDPEIRGGRPSVGGISTAALWEQAEDGAAVPDLVDLFGLTIRDVRWALSYESEEAARAA
ncbi:hypothetical protein JL107_08485 [Nakamurella flavida]|uniref:DUF433 domain-containing protein n=1 Tax=Nakamurella flavida TaxID=363630 RepID=A0A939C2E2_9ACTN|nr:hypothetical protein [Nakamurella flavida]MBM9476475.1 hypothetical protein [Nakamurella flavida]MDP9779425.1 uncharacterized protein (DUF433 family) [Nakamurella flavida]